MQVAQKPQVVHVDEEVQGAKASLVASHTCDPQRQIAVVAGVLLRNCGSQGFARETVCDEPEQEEHAPHLVARTRLDEKRRNIGPFTILGAQCPPRRRLGWSACLLMHADVRPILWQVIVHPAMHGAPRHGPFGI